MWPTVLLWWYDEWMWYFQTKAFKENWLKNKRIVKTINLTVQIEHLSGEKVLWIVFFTMLSQLTKMLTNRWMNESCFFWKETSSKEKGIKTGEKNNFLKELSLLCVCGRDLLLYLRHIGNPFLSHSTWLPISQSTLFFFLWVMEDR